MKDREPPKPAPTEQQPLERGALTGSGAIEAIATAAVSGAAGAAAGAITTKLLSRPKTEVPPAPKSKIVLPPGTKTD